MGLLTRMHEAHEAGFQRKVKYYMQKAALAVLGEESTTKGHTERVAYAKKVLDGTASIYEFAVGVTTNSTIAAKLDAKSDYDSDLEFVINSMFSDFAGYDG
jgi:hypothetical protein